MPITDICNVKLLTRQRNAFFSALKSLKAPGLKNLAYHEFTFSTQMATNITNFLFSDLMGTKAFQNLIALIREYQGTDKEGNPYGAALRARNLGRDLQVPEEMRQVYFDIGELLGSKRTEQSALTRFMMYMTYEELATHHNALVQACETDRQSIREYIRSTGYEIQQGKKLLDIMLEFMVQDLGLPKLGDFLQNAKMIVEISDHFGSGVLLLLPKGALTR